MKKYKIKFIALIFFLIIIPGILLVNSQYNRKSGREPGEEVYVSSDETGIPLKFDSYYEFRLSKKSSRKLRIYYTYKPFDLRFNIGDYVLVINKRIFSNVYQNTERVTERGIQCFQQGLVNAKETGIKIIDSAKGKVMPVKAGE